MTNKEFQAKQKTCFTIIPTKVSGFTDKLNQFDALYRLGCSMGFQYYHTDFKSSRSSDIRELNSNNLFLKILLRFQKVLEKIKLKINPNSDVFDFIGFNKSLNERNKTLNLNNFSKIEVVFDNELVCKNNENSLNNLKNSIKKALSSCSNSHKFILFKMQQSGRSLLKPIFLNIPLSQNELELREKYFEQRENSNFVSKFDDKKLKVLVHIRQGDTGVIKTPWKTYISSYSMYKYIEDSFEELDSLAQIKSHRNIEAYVFKNFLEKLVSFYDENKFSIIFFSDGFKRAFKGIYNRADKLKLTKKQKFLLIKSESDYDRNYFKILKSIRNSKLIIGEDKEKLHSLIHSIFEADIILVGNQQSMIPKFLAVYFDITNIPQVIVLYKKVSPKYPFLSKEIIDNKFIFVDVDNPNYEEVFSKINLKISYNQALTPSSQ